MIRNRFIARRKIFLRTGNCLTIFYAAHRDSVACREAAVLNYLKVFITILLEPGFIQIRVQVVPGRASESGTFRLEGE